MHWTSFRRQGVLRYSVLLEDTTEVDLVQADGGWKLCYSTCTSAAKDWTVVDLGSFDNEGELLIAADDRLAELLEWPELAQETTLLRRQSRQAGSAGDSS
jgi:hypothetical protein